MGLAASVVRTSLQALFYNAGSRLEAIHTIHLDWFHSKANRKCTWLLAKEENKELLKDAIGLDI
jgi:hypothetical protein